MSTKKKPSKAAVKRPSGGAKNTTMSKEKTTDAADVEVLDAEAEAVDAEIQPLTVYTAGPLAALDTWPNNYDLSDYIPPLYGSLTTNPLSALTKAKISDFKVNLSYKVARRVGQKNNGGTGQETPTPVPPIWEDMYELVERVVSELNINQDLMDFQQAVYKGNAYSPGTGVVVTGVTLDSPTAAMSVGQQKQLIATVAPANASIKGVTWSSANHNIASVSGTGVIIAIGAGGPINVTATSIGDPTKTAACAVTVT